MEILFAIQVPCPAFAGIREIAVCGIEGVHRGLHVVEERRVVVEEDVALGNTGPYISRERPRGLYHYVPGLFHQMLVPLLRLPTGRREIVDIDEPGGVTLGIQESNLMSQRFHRTSKKHGDLG